MADDGVDPKESYVGRLAACARTIGFFPNPAKCIYHLRRASDRELPEFLAVLVQLDADDKPFKWGDEEQCDRLRESLFARPSNARRRVELSPSDSAVRLECQVSTDSHTARCLFSMKASEGGMDDWWCGPVCLALLAAIREFLLAWLRLAAPHSRAGMPSGEQDTEEGLLGWLESEILARLELQRSLLEPEVRQFDAGAAFLLAVDPEALFLGREVDEAHVEYHYRLGPHLSQISRANLADRFADLGSECPSKVAEYMDTLLTTPMGRVGRSLVTDVMERRTVTRVDDWRQEGGYVWQPSAHLAQAEKIAFSGLWSQVLTPLFGPGKMDLALRGLLFIPFGRRSPDIYDPHANEYVISTVMDGVEELLDFVSDRERRILERPSNLATSAEKRLEGPLLSAVERVRTELRTLPAAKWQRIDDALRAGSASQTWTAYRSWLHHALSQSLQNAVPADVPSRYQLRRGLAPAPVRALRDDPMYEPLRSQVAGFADLIDYFWSQTHATGTYQLEPHTVDAARWMARLIWCGDGELSCGECLTCVLLNRGMHLKQVLDRNVRRGDIRLRVESLNSEHRLGFGPWLVVDVASHLFFNVGQNRRERAGHLSALYGLLADPGQRDLDASIDFSLDPPGCATVDITVGPIDFCFESDFVDLSTEADTGLRGAIRAFLLGVPTSPLHKPEVVFTSRVASWPQPHTNRPVLRMGTIRFTTDASPSVTFSEDAGIGREQRIRLHLPFPQSAAPF